MVDEVVKAIGMKNKKNKTLTKQEKQVKTESEKILKEKYQHIVKAIYQAQADFIFSQGRNDIWLEPMIDISNQSKHERLPIMEPDQVCCWLNEHVKLTDQDIGEWLPISMEMKFSGWNFMTLFPDDNPQEQLKKSRALHTELCEQNVLKKGRFQRGSKISMEKDVISFLENHPPQKFKVIGLIEQMIKEVESLVRMMAKKVQATKSSSQQSGRSIDVQKSPPQQAGRSIDVQASSSTASSSIGSSSSTATSSYHK
mmetsp:Transcript_2985/g.4352  ORF Transcript_2985/g.4352 Transcript_2985/m.4352 type:complete len:255 (+) Transcript_2985:3-767(+)